MIVWGLGTSLQWISYTEAFSLCHFPTYHVLPESVSVFLIRFDGSLETFCNLDSILVFDNMSLSMSRNDIGHTDKLLRILGEAPLPLSIGRVEGPIISCIGGKGGIVVFLFWYSCANIIYCIGDKGENFIFLFLCSCVNMSLFLCPRAPLIPNHHLEISCGRQYFQIPTYYIHPNYYS